MRAMMRQTHIRRKRRRIPFIYFWDLVAYFDSIDAKLSASENLENAFMLLELAVWKSKITERYGQNNGLLTIEMKMRYRTDSVSMVRIIVPNVLSFLTDGYEENEVVDADDENGDDSDDDVRSRFLHTSDNEDSDDDDDDDEDEDYGEVTFIQTAYTRRDTETSPLFNDSNNFCDSSIDDEENQSNSPAGTRRGVGTSALDDSDDDKDNKDDSSNKANEQVCGSALQYGTDNILFGNFSSDEKWRRNLEEAIK